ncbi:SHD1 domain-containing protein [Aeoliella sp.]|uniref:SHD1 domain-containing protein n=1 Tax=Aeoliella sp. TaxID=2795800 RepID=UPI003CCBFB43
MFVSISRRVLVALTIAAILQTAAVRAEMRTWTDITGKFSVEAELVEVKDGKAVLKKTSGENVAVPIEKLSKADQEFLQQSDQSNESELNLTLPNAMTEPPEWLASDPGVPFDLNEFFKVPPQEENAAPLYIKAMAESNLRLALHVRGLERESEEGQAFLEEPRRRSRAASKFWIKFYDYEDEPTEHPEPPASEAMAVMGPFDQTTQMLLEAQNRNQCVFQVDRTWDGVRTFDLPLMMEVRAYYALKAGNVEAVLQYFQIELRFSRDLQPRGELSRQLTASRHAHYACVDPESTDSSGYISVANRLLASDFLTVAHCDRWIQLLQQHLDEQGDYFVDQCCADYIIRRGILHDLQSGEYRQIMKEFDMRVPPTGPNPYVYLKDISLSLWSDSPERLHPLLSKAQGPPSPAGEEARLKYSQKLASMRDSDYQREIAALNKCYKNLLALGELPIRERIEQVAKVREPLLDTDVAIWLAPNTNRHILEKPLVSDTNVYGTLCLVAMKRLQLENGAPPTDLAAALKAAGIDEIPIDPFTDEPLRTADVDGKLVVYSVGTDVIDDGGTVLYDYQKKQGDFVFKLPN